MLTPLRALWRSTFELYRADDAESAAIRAQHLGAVVRLVPALVLAMAVNATALVALMVSAAGVSLLLWSLAMLALLLVMLATGLKWRRRPRQLVSRRALRRAAWQSGALAGLWGLAPLLWFDAASPDERVLLTALISGMMAGGAVVLVPLPASALAYVSVLATLSLVTLLRHADPALVLTAVLVLSYAATLVLGALSGARTATALLRAQRDAARQGHLVQVLLQDFEDNAAEALWETDAAGRLVRVSPRLASLLVVDEAALPGARALALLEARAPASAAALRQAFDTGRPFRGLQLEVGSGLDTRWWTLTGKPLFDETGRPLGWRGVIADATSEVRARQRLRQLAHHDTLTGLANRLTLHELLRERLQSAQGGALLVIDLDHFKAINDSLGHSIGDAVLKLVAVRLSACVRPGDLVARLGGDEFAMVLAAPAESPLGRAAPSAGDKPCGTATSACGGDEALALARRVVLALQEPCDTAGRVLRVGASVGVALLPQHGQTVDELIGHADVALYDAKGQGRGRAVLYSDDLGARSRRRAELEHGLRQAAARGELALHWQPQVDLRSWTIVGVEALLRWQHPQLGAIRPAEFIALAEASGQIEALGRWVLDEACRTAATQLPGLSVSVNVSPVQLRDAGFADQVQAALQAHGLDPARLELEITESLFIDDADAAVQRLQALRRLGVRIALDDFGTGYSSLAYLRRFPFDTLKIDRAFVSELLQRDDARAIVRTITQLATALGMHTVAEGVESAAQLDAVRQAGCAQAQGFWMSAPCSLQALLQLRQGWAARGPAAPLQA